MRHCNKKIFLTIHIHQTVEKAGALLGGVATTVLILAALLPKVLKNGAKIITERVDETRNKSNENNSKVN